MVELLQGIVDFFTNIFNFFHSVIDTVTGFIESVSSWWKTMLVIIGMFPPAVVGICVAAFALLLAFVVIEILRDFL